MTTSQCHACELFIILERVLVHSTIRRIRRSVVERCQIGLGSSTTPVECKSPLKVDSMASIAIEATRSYI